AAGARRGRPRRLRRQHHAGGRGSRHRPLVHEQAHPRVRPRRSREGASRRPRGRQTTRRVNMHAVTLETLDKKIADLTYERDQLAGQLKAVKESASKEQHRIEGWRILWEPSAGAEIGECCRRLQAHADATGQYATMRFNDAQVSAWPGGSPE